MRDPQTEELIEMVNSLVACNDLLLRLLVVSERALLEEIRRNNQLESELEIKSGPIYNFSKN